jgi:MFS transporter, SP family, galactose:H+ symporter
MSSKTVAKERCTAYLLFVVIVGAFGGFLYGFFTGVISGALLPLATAFRLSTVDQGVVVSILLLGGLVGALAAGMLADRFGRKWTMSLTSLIFIAGALLTALSYSYEWLLFGRFFSGIGVGIIVVVAPLYLAEISPAAYRGAFVSLFQLAVAMGILFSFFVNYLFIQSGEWRWMFGVGILPALLQMIALFFLPETPAWLLKTGQKRLAAKAFSKLRKDTHWKEQISAAKTTSSTRKQGGWKTLFSPQLRLIAVVGIILSSLQQITGINTVIFYAPKIFETTGFQSANSAIIATISIGVMNALATLLSVWLSKKMGRRTLLLMGSAGMGISLILFSIAYFAHLSLIGGISILTLMAYVAFFAIGLGPITLVVLSEIFPLKVRGLAMTIALSANWICNYLVSLTFLGLIERLSLPGTFLLYGLISLCAFWFIYRFIPETHGKTLEEIEEQILSGRLS